MNRNLNTNEISARLGHSNTSTTVNIYGHVLKTADQAASDAIGNVMFKKKDPDPEDKDPNNKDKV